MNASTKKTFTKEIFFVVVVIVVVAVVALHILSALNFIPVCFPFVAFALIIKWQWFNIWNIVNYSFICDVVEIVMRDKRTQTHKDG